MPAFKILKPALLDVVTPVLEHLPPVVVMSVTVEDMLELLHVSLGYIPRRQLSTLNLYRKLLDVAQAKFSPERSLSIAQGTTYELLTELERYLERIYRVRLHYTTHVILEEDTYIVIREFDIPVKPYQFDMCPTCGRVAPVAKGAEHDHS